MTPNPDVRRLTLATAIVMLLLAYLLLWWARAQTPPPVQATPIVVTMEATPAPTLVTLTAGSPTTRTATPTWTPLPERILTVAPTYTATPTSTPTGVPPTETPTPEATRPAVQRG